MSGLHVLAERMKLMEDRIKQYQPIYRAWIGFTPAINVTKPEHAEVSDLVPKS
jgi:hypothetical protein